MSFLNTWNMFFNKRIPNIALRIVVMFLDLAFIGFGIALSRATNMGTTVISCIPAVLSYSFTDISMGTFTFWFNIFLLSLQIVLLRRNFKPLQLLCVLFLFVFSAIIDFFVPVAEAIPMPNYFFCLLFSLIACIFIAIGVWLQVQAKLILLPGDGFVLTVSSVFKTDFSKTKVVNDCTLMAIGSVMSFILMGGLYGVREGTVLAAVLVGLIIKGINKLVPNFEQVCPTVGHPTLTPER